MNSRRVYGDYDKLFLYNKDFKEYLNKNPDKIENKNKDDLSKFFFIELIVI